MLFFDDTPSSACTTASDVQDLAAVDQASPPTDQAPAPTPWPEARRHVIQMSGGLGSFFAAVRVAERYGTSAMTLLFADTTVEDPDLHRFLRDAAAFLELEVVRVCDGRAPFDVFDDVHFLGNSRVAPCTKFLKQKPCRDWLKANCDVADTAVYIGIDHFEARRTPAILDEWKPWRAGFPMCDPPYWDKDTMIAECRALGIEPPLLYKLGFKHNNCGGICVRAGMTQWRHALKVFPERFAEAERREAEFRAKHGDHTILRQQRNGLRRNLTLTQLRQRAETVQTSIFDPDQGLEQTGEEHTSGGERRSA
ncbi:hypothetical protein [Nonomuraea jabiensis]|uniref:hypothetical protein n=1 Tax=Nonomuraea jabiensis TaxID=882448 RepID=UPI003D720BA3